MVSRNPNYQIPSNLEERHTKLEIRHNQISIISMILAMVFSVWNVWQQVSLNNQQTKIDELQTDIQTMTLVESLIDDLTANKERRDIALSALYGVLVLERKEHNKSAKYPSMIVDIAETILASSYKKGNLDESSKALVILGELDIEKHKQWVEKMNEEDPYFAAETLGLREKRGVKGLVYIQYNNQSKKVKVEQYREQLSAKNWNAPGTEFISQSNFPNRSEIRFFNKEDEVLAKELKADTEAIVGCSDCLTTNMIKGYRSVPKKQLELWIDLESLSN
ncbi:hypothetical protein [Crocosphaera sp. Alani8]|uniref:hypothetical protein n=1 Tax=Crocosphaera sp. Alani8 TaxID=3038952 RepID=UPI00313F0A51